MKKENLFNSITQFALPALTIAAQLVTSLKHPEYGMIIALLSQPFWLYTSWKSYREAGQIGLMVTTLIMLSLYIVGVINYWVL